MLAFNSRKNLSNNYLLTERRDSCKEDSGSQLEVEQNSTKEKQSVDNPNMRQHERCNQTEYMECPETEPFYINYPTGQLAIEGTLINRRLSGMRRSYYTDSAPKAIDVYLNGVRDGQCESYYPNGDMKCEGVYRAIAGNPARIGEWRTYWEETNNELKEIKRYDSNGKKHGVSEYYNINGNLTRRITYNHGEETNREDY